jgi:hypothetical protein
MTSYSEVFGQAQRFMSLPIFGGLKLPQLFAILSTNLYFKKASKHGTARNLGDMLVNYFVLCFGGSILIGIISHVHDC